jgi:hypothetical protein
MVIDKELPLGLIANTAAVLAASLGRQVDGLIGKDVLDQDETLHPGITQATISLLSGDSPLIHSIRQKLVTDQPGDLYFVDFCDVAQRSKKYEDYTAQLSQTPENELHYLGIAIYGPNKQVDRLTGSIALLR